jgi:hypothetical protein
MILKLVPENEKSLLRGSKIGGKRPIHPPQKKRNSSELYETQQHGRILKRRTEKGEI